MAEILERSGYLVKVRVEVPADRVKASYEALLKDLSSKTLRSAWWRRPTPRRCGSSA